MITFVKSTICMKRNVYESLLKWKHSSDRKPLILKGARQVGKTWLMKEFGKNEFKDVVYINFDYDTWAKDLFKQDYEINRILLFIQAHTGIQIKDEDTLIIFDELQEAERGLGCLKYFYENAPQYYIIAAGSLLGLAMHQAQSFPVGKVNMLTVYPMTFLEFLQAKGEDAKAQVLVKNEWDIQKVMMPAFTDLLREYYYVGGMPEVVESYCKTGNLVRVREIQTEILSAYRDDISKHAPSKEIPIIRMVMDSIPSQLAKQNKKFIYGMLKQGSRAKDYEVAIQWLIDAGIVYKINRVNDPEMPLAFYEDYGVFKLFLLDCGLLGCMVNAPAGLVLTNNDIFKEYKGAFSEEYVLEQLKTTNLPIFYWSANNSQSEIDFLVQTEKRVIPIEVKAEDNVHSQSLHVFCTDKYPQLKGLRCSMKPYIDQGWMENIPLFSIEAYIQNPK